jgi:hypothetical protein
MTEEELKRLRIYAKIIELNNGKTEKLKRYELEDFKKLLKQRMIENDYSSIDLTS